MEDMEIDDYWQSTIPCTDVENENSVKNGGPSQRVKSNVPVLH